MLNMLQKFANWKISLHHRIRLDVQIWEVILTYLFHLCCETEGTILRDVSRYLRYENKLDTNRRTAMQAPTQTTLKLSTIGIDF